MCLKFCKEVYVISVRVGHLLLQFLSGKRPMEANQKEDFLDLDFGSTPLPHVRYVHPRCQRAERGNQGPQSDANSLLSL